MKKQNFTSDDVKYIELLKNESPLYVIKVYKDEKECELAEAKEYIDNLRTRIAADESAGEVQSSNCDNTVDYSEDGCQPNIAFADNKNNKIDERKYIELLKEGHKLGAVKAYKEDTGCGLAEAKEYIDNLPKRSDVQEELRKARVERADTKDGSRNGGCLSSIALLLIVVSVVACFL